MKVLDNTATDITILASIPDIRMNNHGVWCISDIPFNGYGMTSLYITPYKRFSFGIESLMFNVRLPAFWIEKVFIQKYKDKLDDDNNIHMQLKQCIEYYKAMGISGIASIVHYVNDDLATKVERDPFSYINYSELPLGKWWIVSMIREYAKTLIK